MQYTIKAPKELNAVVALPASKSISNRALIINALAGGGTRIDNLSDCDDTMVIVRALQSAAPEIDIMAAGTAMRFMTALLAVTPGRRTITGTERMRQRPISVLVDALRYLGADVQYAGQEGFPPLRIAGKSLEGGHLDISGNVSSQYISALLMVGPVLKNGLELRLTDSIISRPYIDLTLWMMKGFGADVDWTDIDTVRVKPKPYTTHAYTVENDWSAASYWYEMVALAGAATQKVVLEGLMDGSRQGDSGVRYIFSLLGVKTAFATADDSTPTEVTLKYSGRCVPRLEYDFVNAPDLAQTFVVCCAELGVQFRFTGLQTLKIKETDRIEALKREMRKLGYVIRDVDGCELVWDGQRCPAEQCPAIDTYNDHRMAMVFAPLALTRGEIRINNPEVVTKSYPHFWQDLEKAGFAVEKNA